MTPAATLEPAAPPDTAPPDTLPPDTLPPEAEPEEPERVLLHMPVDIRSAAAAGRGSRQRSRRSTTGSSA